MGTTATLRDFRLNDTVRLLDDRSGVRSGSLGRVLGRFARETDPTYLVSFEGKPAFVTEVGPDEIVLAIDSGTSG